MTTQLNQQTRPIYSIREVFDSGMLVQDQQMPELDSMVLWSERAWENILLHFRLAVTSKSLGETFYELAETWRQETKYMSSIQQITSNASYQQIIGMGEKALPLIFREMQRQSGHWFLALQRITRVNPIQPQNRGDMENMTIDWLNWGRDSGYIRF